jgi:3-hydroxyethyl bacteriochlorophyllide a dehydrogenase
VDAVAIILEAPERLALRSLSLLPMTPAMCSLRSTGAAFPPGPRSSSGRAVCPASPAWGTRCAGYESIGRIVDAGADARGGSANGCSFPGASCFRDARGLFGGTARHVVLPAARAIPISESLGRDGVLLALAATAHHAIGVGGVPDLVIGHGVLGRLIARIAIATGGGAPTVWEVDPARREGCGYAVIDPAADERRDYRVICDASGAADALDLAFPRLAKGGEVVLAGFYDRLSFAFPPAFMREARMRVSAEFTPADVAAVVALTDVGLLELDGLLSHVRPAAEAADAYPQAFTDPDCLKIALDWRTI